MEIDDKQFAKIMGRRIRDRREILGFSQGKLGEQLGMTFQQVQKYENGVNRVAGYNLWRMAHIFHCQPGDFFPVDSDVVILTDELTAAQHRMAGRVVKAFLAIKSIAVQQRALDLLQALGKGAP